MSLQNPDQGARMRSQRLLVAAVPHAVAGEVPAAGACGLPWSPHPNLCCAGSAPLERLAQKHCISGGSGGPPAAHADPARSPELLRSEGRAVCWGGQRVQARPTWVLPG